MFENTLIFFMRGRALEVIIQPFSFRELLVHQTVPMPAALSACRRSTTSSPHRAFPVTKKHAA